MSLILMLMFLLFSKFLHVLIYQIVIESQNYQKVSHISRRLSVLRHETTAQWN